MGCASDDGYFNNEERMQRSDIYFIQILVKIFVFL